MNFGKVFLASLLAVVVSGGLLLFMIFGMIGASMSSMSSNKSEGVVLDNSILQISLKNKIVENHVVTADPFGDLDLSKLGPLGMGNESKMGLHQIVKAIEAAKTDDRVRGIYLTLSPMIQTGWASMRSIHTALKDFKTSEKFVYAYAEIYTEKSYYLASLADEIYMPETGSMEFNGFATSRMFYTGMFEKLELEPKIFKVGKFKSAVEPYFRKEMSEESRYQTKMYMGALWSEFVKDVSEARGMSEAQINQMAENFVLGNGKKSVAAGFVNENAFETDVYAKIRDKMGKEKDEKLRFVKLKKYMKSVGDGDYSEDKVAVIFAEGAITSGESKDGNMGSETIVKAIRKARKDENVKAIVLRVNSPGGSALASSMMANEIRLASADKPIICSMGDVAASGGYYIAALCDAIYAEKNTITGSIGIFGMWMSTKDLFNNKIGLTFDEEETHTHANIGHPNFEMTEAEGMRIQNMVNEGYGDFLGIVQEGRADFFTDSTAVDVIAQGRVWAGSDAKGIHLIDEYGSLYDAIAEAAKRANVDDYKLRLLPKSKSPLEEIFGESFAAMQLKGHPLENELKELVRLKKTFSAPDGLYMMLPYSTDIK